MNVGDQVTVKFTGEVTGVRKRVGFGKEGIVYTVEIKDSEGGFLDFVDVLLEHIKVRVEAVG